MATALGTALRMEDGMGLLCHLGPGMRLIAPLSIAVCRFQSSRLRPHVIVLAPIAQVKYCD